MPKKAGKPIIVKTDIKPGPAASPSQLTAYMTFWRKLLASFAGADKGAASNGK